MAAIQHGDADIFAILLTYDYNGNPTYLVTPSRAAEAAAGDSTKRFTGDVYGMAFLGNHFAFDPSRVTVRREGSATMRFAPDAPGPATLTLSTDALLVPVGDLVRLPFGQ